ncbi:MAG: DNA recombination/repair protein RecA, partial [Acidimicrobiaceae bacterium]|nr:DNA recombination/repair protein RecA [Acidimicrobiaceae bacterium]
TYDGEQLGQGRENAKAFLQDNPELMVEISDLVWRAVMPEPEPEPEWDQTAASEPPATAAA